MTLLLALLFTLTFLVSPVAAIDVNQLTEDQNYQYNLYRTAHTVQTMAELEYQKNPSLPNQNKLYTTAKISMQYRLAITKAYLAKLNYLFWSHPEKLPATYPSIADEINRQQANIVNLSNQLNQITTLDQLLNFENRFFTIYDELVLLRPQIIGLLIEANLRQDLTVLNDNANNLYRLISTKESLIPDKERYYQWISQVNFLISTSNLKLKPLAIKFDNSFNSSERQLDEYITAAQTIESQLLTAQRYLLDITNQMQAISL